MEEEKRYFLGKTEEITPDDKTESDIFSKLFFEFFNKALEEGLTSRQIIYSMFTSCLVNINMFDGKENLHRALKDTLELCAKIDLEKEGTQ